LTIRSDSTGRTPRGDVRDAARVGDAREERHVALAAALEHEDSLLVGVYAERVEDERERELLRPSLDEDRTAGEEELRAIAVELGERAEGLGLRERLRLEERRSARRRVADERELLELVDAEKDRRVGRVEDLVSRLGERAEESVEMALRVRAEIELGLLDQEHEVAEIRGHEPLHARDEREPAVRRGPVMVGRGRQQELGDLGRSAPGGGCDHRPRAEVRGQEEHGRRSRPVEVERVGRTGVEEDRSLRHVGFEADPSPGSVAGHVVDGRRRGGGLQQCPDRREHGGLAARRLADECADGAGRELELAGRAIPLDRDASERR
jgi:hypothetical protein